MGWGDTSAFILFIIMIATVSSCRHQRDQVKHLDRIATALEAR